MLCCEPCVAGIPQTPWFPPLPPINVIKGESNVIKEDVIKGKSNVIKGDVIKGESNVIKGESNSYSEHTAA